MPSTTLPSTSPAAPPRSIAKTHAGQRHQDGADEHHPALAEAVGRLAGRDGEHQRDDGEGGGERARATAGETSELDRPVRRRGPQDEGDDLGERRVQQQEGEQPASGIAHRVLVRAGQPVGRPRAEAGLDVPAHQVGRGVRVAVPDGLEQQPVLGGPGVALLVAPPGLEPVPAVAVGLHPEPVEDVAPAGRCARRGGWRRGTGGGSPAAASDGGCSAPRARRARARTSARSASVRRCAAREAASGSRLRRSSSRSRASVASSGRTRASRWASSSTRPSCLSRRSASRRGVVLIPIAARARPAGGRRPGRARRSG